MLRLSEETDSTLQELAKKKGQKKASYARLLITERIEQILKGDTKQPIKESEDSTIGQIIRGRQHATPE